MAHVAQRAYACELEFVVALRCKRTALLRFFAAKTHSTRKLIYDRMYARSDFEGMK